MPTATKIRRLLIVLGDQLDHNSSLFDGIEPDKDAVWMAEVKNESQHVWSHKARIVMFLSAMRHFRDELRKKGITVAYQCLEDNPNTTLAETLSHFLAHSKPNAVFMVKPGDYRVYHEIQQVTEDNGLPLSLASDTHFLCSSEEFSNWSASRKEYRLEHFYRYLRRKNGILMTGDSPSGGKWNYDAENRKSFTRQGPGMLPPWPSFAPDKITREVIRIVNALFPDHPGELSGFDWPVKRDDALLALDDFIDYRLATFGPFQDAMWTDEPFLYHSGLSAAMNLKLLSPKEVIDAAINTYADKKLALSSLEGFIRQILGWREFMRGFYWQFMPELKHSNALNADTDLPAFYWNAKTDMRCLSQVIGQVLELGYAHHIQRLMVTGLFALLLGVKPHNVHEWYLAMFVDAVEWVELPNTLGMSQYADGGTLASKPYVASGKYINRMSNYCQSCRYNPAKAVGKDACPFTTLYWDFLQRHRKRFQKHPRTALQWRNLERLDTSTRKTIRQQADDLRNEINSGNRIL